MPDQNRSPDGIPRKDTNRPSPDVDAYATDGQSNARGKGATDQQGGPPPESGRETPIDPDAKNVSSRLGA